MPATLRKENGEIPRLQEKLKKANATADHYRNRCRDRRSTLSSTLQQIEAQACIIDSTLNTLRSVSRRVKRDLHADDAPAASSSSSRHSTSRTPSVAPSQHSKKTPSKGGDSRRTSSSKPENKKDEVSISTNISECVDGSNEAVTL